ncbi:tumor necrosis factor alpha-induced protein 8-like protein 3 [Corvus kubaryi]|uniref:tumor necrosis factor alpha-induced protein 8-like protein 3 n=1 Tax=Corvus kubaryi TaxID=68294 RepID=UPI001C04AE84|nr:tumor necrosis factor alpha-induced protein 8-like protein 3 [Corvus kubaryi]
MPTRRVMEKPDGRCDGSVQDCHFAISALSSRSPAAAPSRAGRRGPGSATRVRARGRSRSPPRPRCLRPRRARPAPLRPQPMALGEVAACGGADPAPGCERRRRQRAALRRSGHSSCQRRPELPPSPAGACSMDSDSAELSEGELVSPAGPDYFSSKNLALQAQKKILSKMATKTMANMLIDDTSSEIFDELYKVTKEHTRNKKEAHKIMKDLIKVAIKIGILYRNNQFNQEELEIVDKFRKKLNQTAMTIVSFYEVEYTFDRNVLAELLNECKDLVHELVGRHLTARSHGRINHVFNHFADVEFLSALYSLDGDCRPYLKKICNGINKLLDEKVL